MIQKPWISNCVNFHQKIPGNGTFHLPSRGWTPNLNQFSAERFPKPLATWTLQTDANLVQVDRLRIFLLVFSLIENLTSSISSLKKMSSKMFVNQWINWAPCFHSVSGSTDKRLRISIWDSQFENFPMNSLIIRVLCQTRLIGKFLSFKGWI